MRVMTILGTRPEIIRLSRIIPALDDAFDHLLVHTGQNYDYELNGIFFDQLGLRAPDRYLDAAGATAAETIGAVIARAGAAIAELTPDAVLILGDTNSALAAIAAKRARAPVFHMEAGNRCFDDRVPEEVNRRIVDHVADINLPYSQLARENLIREGFPPDRVIVTGSPMREIIEHYAGAVAASGVLGALGLEPGRYFVVSAHREETVDAPERLAALCALLGTVADRYGLPIVFSTHPRTGRRLGEAGMMLHPLVRLAKPFGFPDYVRLQREAKAVLSDSGTITEESSILDLPALNLRDVHERPEGFEEAAVMLTGLSPERVLAALRVLEARAGRPGERATALVRDYAPVNVSAKIVRIILSYTDYVNRRVWSR